MALPADIFFTKLRFDYLYDFVIEQAVKVLSRKLRRAGILTFIIHHSVLDIACLQQAGIFKDFYDYLSVK
jgi:hypothetical protein